MKNFTRVIVLITFTLSMAIGLWAQTRPTLSPEQLRMEIKRERERYMDVIIEVAETLPVLYRQDPNQATRAVTTVSTMLDDQLSFSAEYRPFSPKEVAYLKGHLLAYQQAPENLYQYYKDLIQSSRITDDQPAMSYLLYLMQIQDTSANSRVVANQLLNSLMNNGAQDRASLLYNFLWTDMTAAMGDSTAVAAKLAEFTRTRDLITNQIVPRKQAIAQRIQAIATDPFFSRPDLQRAGVLATSVDGIKADLGILYGDLLPLEGLIRYDELVSTRDREMALLDSLKSTIAGFTNNENWINERKAASEGVLASLNESHVYFSALVEKIDRVFGTVESSYGDEYAYYLDVETKILLDLIGASVIYAHAVELIDVELSYSAEIPAEQRADFLSKRDTYLNESIRLLGQYDEYYARFTQDNVWKSHYDTVINSYIDALRQQISLETGINEVQYALQGLERRRMLAVGLPSNLNLSDAILTENAVVFESLYSYLTLQRDFRLIQYRDQRRLSNLNSISYDENVALLDMINRDKQDYVMRAQRFVRDYPTFQGFLQPTGDYLVSLADLYYNIAEFQYALDPNNPGAALASYKRVKEINPTYALADKVNYNIGFLSMNTTINAMDARRTAFFESNPTAVTYSNDLKFQESNFNESIAAFQSVIDLNADPSLRDESHLHLAAMYFLLASDSTTPDTYYNLALSNLNPMVADASNSRHFEALYQRGVIYMNYGGNAGYRNAINDYAALLMGIKTGVVTDPGLIQDYQDAAVDNISFALIALDGEDFEATAQGAELEAFLVDYEDETVLARIYDRAAQQKSQELGSPLQARDFLMAKIRRMPRTLDNPAGIHQTVILYNQFYQDLPADRKAIMMNPNTYRYNQYQYLIDNYGPESTWFQTNRNNPAIGDQLALIDTAYATVERRLINNFSQAISNQNASQTERQAAFTAYREHVAKWAGFGDVHAGRLAARQQEWQTRTTDFSAVLAESSNSPKDWYDAYAILTTFNDTNPSQASFQNEGLAFRFAQSLLDDQAPKYADTGYRPMAGIPQNADDLYGFYEGAALRFVASAISPENLNANNQQLAFQTLMGLGDMNVQRGRLANAQAYYLRLLQQGDAISDADERTLYLKLADIASTQNRFADAEAAYRQALVLASDSQDAALIQNQIIQQIQYKIDSAEAAKDYQTTAQDYLRLAAEFRQSNPEKYLGFQIRAHEHYVMAGQHQNAIDILMQLATDRRDKAGVYELHYKAWGLADSLMHDAAQTQRIKDSFIARYPNSLEAFNLHLLAIEPLKENPQTKMLAAQKYLELYDRARQNTIETGETTPDEIYIWAISIYINENQVEERNRHFESFIQSYPNHPNTIVYMQGLADHYWATGDTLSYERYARDIFRKDRNLSGYYKRLADARLGKLAADFDAAFINKNWPVVFATRDEFTRMESAYKREGLSFETEAVYQAFAQAQTEYDRIQAQIAFYRRYDTQLGNLERTGFISRSPGALITLNANTTWQRHLFGGRPNRVAALQPVVTAEVNRVLALLNNNTEFELDNTRRLRALDLISRINEHAKYAIETQVERYFETANEFAQYRNRNRMSAEEYNELVTTMRAYAAQFTSEYLNAAYSMYLQTYNTYYMAGYRDVYANRAKAKLAEWAVEPNYQVDEYPMNTEWDISLGNGGRLSLISSVTSPNGITMGKISIPGNTSLILSKTVNTRIQPDFGFIQMVFPYDAEIKINDRAITPAFVPADTLTAGEAMTTRYALMIDQASWAEGENRIQMTVPNTSTQAFDLCLSLQLVMDRERLATAVPVETVKLVSNPSWTVSSFNPETGEQSPATPVSASGFGIDKASILDLESTTATPIWVNEAESRTDNLIFETSFDVTTIFREGYIDMVAPQTATVYLNGVEIATAEEFYYEDQPRVYYSNRILIDPQNVVSGRNTLRFVVNNNTDFRGFLADVTIKKTIQE